MADLWPRLSFHFWRLRLRSFLLLIAVSTVGVFLLGCLLRREFCPFKSRMSLETKTLEFSIRTQWDGKPLDHDAVKVRLIGTGDGVHVIVDAPFFNDPPSPGTERGKPKQGLWDFEVVEVFFLNDKHQYVEVELCPHGQHLVLLLTDVRKPFQELLPLNFESTISGPRWTGTAIIPWSYLPPGVSRFNAYAIHGSAAARTYEALYPAPQGVYEQPDFHRLEYFGRLNMDSLWPSTLPVDEQNYWSSRTS